MNAKSEATSDSTPAGAGPELSDIEHPEQHARPDTPTPGMEHLTPGEQQMIAAENRWNDHESISDAVDDIMETGCQLGRELAATRASEAMYIERCRKAESELATERKAREGAEYKLQNIDWWCETCKQRYNCPPDYQCSRASCDKCGTWMLSYQEYRAGAAESRAAQMFERTKERCIAVCRQAPHCTGDFLARELDALQPEPEQGGEKT